MTGKLRAVSVLEGLAAGVRRVGLGGVVDRLSPLALRSLGPFSAGVDGLVVHGANLGQQHYVRELRAGREGTLLRLLRSAIPPGGTALDGGAYIGFVTMQAAREAGPSGRVVAVEPHAASADLLERNLSENGLSDRVSVVRKALGAEAGMATFHLSEAGDTSSLYNRVGAVDETEVEVVSGDDLLGDDAVLDVLKLDLEGGELAALRGLERTIERSRDRLTLFVECNLAALEGAGASAEQLVAWIVDAGFEPAWIDEEAGVAVPWGTRAWAGEYVNLVCRPRSAG